MVLHKYILSYQVSFCTA